MITLSGQEITKLDLACRNCRYNRSMDDWGSPHVVQVSGRREPRLVIAINDKGALNRIEVSFPGRGGRRFQGDPLFKVVKKACEDRAIDRHVTVDRETSIISFEPAHPQH